MVRGIDCASRLTAQTAAAIRAEGYAFAGRYLVPDGWKMLTKAEAEAITGAGLRLLTVWETTADRAKGGAAAGAADGAMALKCAREIGMPESGIIYFAVDYEPQAGDMDAIEAYLRAARANTGPYEIGVYGPYSVIETMAERGACKAFWQCVAWSYGRRSGYLDVYQGWFYQQAAGLNVDINECPDMDRAGIWTYEEDVLDMSKDELKQMIRETVKEVMDEENPVIHDLSGVPCYWKETAAQLLDMGVVNGGTPAEENATDLNLRRETLKAIVVATLYHNARELEG